MVCRQLCKAWQGRWVMGESLSLSSSLRAQWMNSWNLCTVVKLRNMLNRLLNFLNVSISIYENLIVRCLTYPLRWNSSSSCFRVERRQRRSSGEKYNSKLPHLAELLYIEIFFWKKKNISNCSRSRLLADSRERTWASLQLNFVNCHQFSRQFQAIWYGEFRTNTKNILHTIYVGY